MSVPTFPTRSRLMVLATLGAVVLSACGGGNDPSPVLKLQVSGLGDLGPNQVYENWLVVNGMPQSAGRFTVDSSGKPSSSEFTLTEAQYGQATAFVLTIEPANNDVPAASEVHLLGGDLDASRNATATIAHKAAVGTDFSSARGSFILATPSSASTTDDDQGLWWIDPSSGSPRPGLSLPTLPAGWKYEGWVVVNGVATSTGKFSLANGADADGAGPTAGPLAAPPFPGQDFINPPLKMPGATAVISVEPDPDNSAAPFQLKPLIRLIGPGTGGSNVQAMANTVGDGSSLPRATVRLTR